MLDATLEAYIERGLEENEITAMGLEREVVHWVNEKANANEYKRRQIAPGLKVTIKAFGSGRRIPIAAAF
jgi:NAD+ synthase (glutamine-hydrolysing)